MKTVREIAEGLAIEINERFSIGVTAIAGMHYDLSKRGGEPRQIGETVNDFINSYQVTHDKFNITVKPDSLYFSEVSPEAQKWEGEVEGLPGAFLKTVIDRNTESQRYLLADPASIDTIMERIEGLVAER